MRPLLLSLFLLSTLPAGAQSPYPQDLFRNPLRIPILLAGNFGECRPGHFHSGIDIKTGGKENEPVHAAAAGYVSRIKMEPGGFGHALYVTHPEGYTTLYAHLNNFAPALQAFTRRAQYAREQWELDTALPAGLFPVKKGALIAWSGNTGGSTAPHLHFEIRNTQTERPLNPQLFGLPITDTRPPVVKQLYLYDLTRSLYGQMPRNVALRKTGDAYVPAGGDTLPALSGFAGIGLVTDDYADGSDNTLAPYTLSWDADGTPAGTITLDDIGYDETRYLHAYADYPTKWKGGPWVQCLFRLPGNALARIYQFPSGTGAVRLSQTGAATPVQVQLRDAAGNESVVRFWLKRSADAPPGCAPGWAPLAPIDYSTPNLRVRGGTTTLYDSLCNPVAAGTAAEAYSGSYRIGRPDVPVQTALQVGLKPNKPVPFALRAKLALVCDDGKDKTGRAARPAEGGWYEAAVRSFGTFYLVPDTVAPRMGPLQRLPGALRVAVSDATTRVTSVRGEIDGRWVLFEQHGSIWTYRYDDRCPPGAHTLVLTATDDLNNIRRTVLSITR